MAKQHAPARVRLSLALVVCAVLALTVAPSTVSAPRSPPPVPIKPNDPAPPPAWVSAGKTQKWLEYLDYCWPVDDQRYCAGLDGIPDTARVVVREGAKVSFHVGFRPTRVELEFPRYGPRNGGLRRLWELAPARTTSWRARDDRGGYAILETRLPGAACTYGVCHAFYAIRFVVKPAKPCGKPR